MKLEIDIPEHHYNNIMALDSVSLGRVPYKGIIMYSINAIKHGKVLDQEPTTKNCESCRYYGSNHEVCNYCYECSLWTEGEPTSKNDLGVDCISRAEMLKYQEYLHGKMSNEENHKLWEFIKDLPSVTPQEPQTFKWCTDCKEYDQEKHCCHRWSKVIRDTVEEMKQEPFKPMVEIDLYSVIKQKYIEREVLDKIRAEIRSNSIYVMPQYGRTIREADVLHIIDKYQAESEVENGNDE